jgi:hypothetical protein
MEAIQFCLSVNKVHLFSLTQTQVCYNSIDYVYMCAACFGLDMPELKYRPKHVAHI